MNAILLAGACIGALTVFLTSDPDVVAAAKAQDQVGWMTHDESINPQTGEKEEVSVIAFLD